MCDPNDPVNRPRLEYATPPPPPTHQPAERVALSLLHLLLAAGGAAMCVPLMIAVSLWISEGGPAHGGGLSILCCAVPAVPGIGLLFLGVRGTAAWSRGGPPR